MKPEYLPILTRLHRDRPTWTVAQNRYPCLDDLVADGYVEKIEQPANGFYRGRAVELCILTDKGRQLIELR